MSLAFTVSYDINGTDSHHRAMWTLISTAELQLHWQEALLRLVFISMPVDLFMLCFFSHSENP